MVLDIKGYGKMIGIFLEPDASAVTKNMSEFKVGIYQTSRKNQSDILNNEISRILK